MSEISKICCDEAVRRAFLECKRQESEKLGSQSRESGSEAWSTDFQALEKFVGPDS